MGLWTKNGSADIGDIYFKNGVQNAALYIGLFNNNFAGDLNTVTIDQLTEPVSTDYVRESLLPVNWIVGDDQVVHPVVDFEVTLESFGTVYGCFIITTASGATGEIFAAHLFTTPIDLVYYGDRLEITPLITIT